MAYMEPRLTICCLKLTDIEFAKVEKLIIELTVTYVTCLLFIYTEYVSFVKINI